MGAPKGNQFWKLRSKHGRDKLFSTPELMWEAACEYFQWCVDNPWVKAEKTKRVKPQITTARVFSLFLPFSEKRLDHLATRDIIGT